MATSTLVQYLETTGKSVTTGADVQLGGGISNRSQVETFLTAGAIVAGDWVMFDTTQTGAARVAFVAQTGVVATGNPLCAGVALKSVTGTATSPQPVEVVVSGYAETANVDGAVVAGSPLSAGAAVAGRAGVATGASIVVCGTALAVDAPVNVGPVWVYKQF
jgi:hypothetical protein